MELASVYVTCPDRDTARRLARLAVERRLAACGNLLPVESVYRWQGAIHEEPEVALLLKTRQERVEALTRALREAHPYEEPCIVAWPIVGGSAGYLAWVEAETGANAP